MGPALARRIALLLFVAGTAHAEDWKPPEAVATRKEFELAYPKSDVTAAALELEQLAADLGIDLAPDIKSRPHPEPDAVKAYQSIGLAATQYLDRELESTQQRIDPPPEAVTQFLVDRQSKIDSIRARLLRPEALAWALDYPQANYTFPVNFVGVVRLQRVLAVYALFQAARGDPDEALETLDALWRLAQSMASRPELMPQLIALPGARFATGVLRKLDVAALGWEDRMRSRALFAAYLAACQNDHWMFQRTEDKWVQEFNAAAARMNARIIDGLSARSACDWSQDALRHAWDVAASGESANAQVIGGIPSDILLDGLSRWHRFLLDCELTALVLEARAEKAASREGAWPSKLRDLESSVCPGSFWSYRLEKDGTVAFAFGGQAPPQGETHGAVLPLTFRAGTARPTPTRTPLTRPTPTHTLPPS